MACVVSNASGTVGGVNVTNISVTCTCTAGGCLIMLASGQNGPFGVALDATSVYWTNGWGDTVMKVPLGGGAPTTLASGQSQPWWGIAVDATSVYWANEGDGTVMKVPIGGGAPTKLASAPGGAIGIAVDATSVYWTIYMNPGSVMKVPLGGGAPTTLASGQNYSSGIVVDATSVYWANEGDGTVMKLTPK